MNIMKLLSDPNMTKDFGSIMENMSKLSETNRLILMMSERIDELSKEVSALRGQITLELQKDVY